MQTHKQGLLALVVTLLSLCIFPGCGKSSPESLLDLENKQPLADLTNQWVDFKFNGEPAKMTTGKAIRVYNYKGLLIYQGAMINGSPQGDGIRYEYVMRPQVALVAYETVDGKKHGLFELYSADYERMLRAQYRNDKLHGPCEMTMPIRIKCTFRDDVLDGAYEEQYRNGGARIQCSYRAGIKQKYIEYYHNGQKRYDLKFKRVLKEEKGFAVFAGREYYENGKLCYKGEFVNYTRACGVRAYIDSRGVDSSKDEFLDEFTMEYHGPGTKYNEQGDKIYDGQWNSGTFTGTKP